MIQDSDHEFVDYVQCKTLGKRCGFKFNGQHAQDKPNDTACAGLHPPFGLFLSYPECLSTRPITTSRSLSPDTHRASTPVQIKANFESAKIESNALDSSRHLNRRWDRGQTQPSRHPRHREGILLCTVRVQSFLISLHSFQNIRSQKYTTSVIPPCPYSTMAPSLCRNPLPNPIPHIS